MTQLTTSQRGLLNSLRDEIENLVIQENEELVRLGSEFGHCAVASEAFYLLTNFNTLRDFNTNFDFPKVYIQRLASDPKGSTHTHFRNVIKGEHGEILEIFDPSHYQFSKEVLGARFRPDYIDVVYPYRRFVGLNSLRSPSTEPLRTNRKSTQYILQMFFKEFPEWGIR